MDVLTILALIIFVLLIPSIIAYHRNHNNRAAILALNICLGWIGVGWVICIVWAFTDNVKEKV